MTLCIMSTACRCMHPHARVNLSQATSKDYSKISCIASAQMFLFQAARTQTPDIHPRTCALQNARDMAASKSFLSAECRAFTYCACKNSTNFFECNSESPQSHVCIHTFHEKLHEWTWPVCDRPPDKNVARTRTYIDTGTYTHAYTNTHMIHIQIMYISTYKSCTFLHTRIHIHTYIHTCAHTYTYICALTCTYARTYTYTCTQMHMHMHIHTDI
jgi:hypothetical protein